MGIPSLRTSIPFMKRDRLIRLATSEDPMISHLVGHSVTFTRECANCTRPPVRVGSVIVNNVFEDKMNRHDNYIRPPMVMGWRRLPQCHISIRGCLMALH